MKTRNRYNTRPEHIRESTTREKVLKNIRHALIEPSENPFSQVEFDSPVHAPIQDLPDVTFATEFAKAGGSFVFCDSPADMVDKVRRVFDDKLWEQAWCNDEPLSAMLRHAGIKVKKANDDTGEMRVAITGCEYLIARTGSIMVSSRLNSGRRMHAYPEVHVVIAFTSQVVNDIQDALEKVRIRYNGRLPSQISLLTGPSRSADIEKTLVMGAHGPKELFVFMADDAG